MNCTKLTPPSPNFITFYYYYSNTMLFLSLSIAPLQFYIILTKSKNLKSFKWLILNHSIWCLLFEVVFAMAKFVYLSPTLGMYQIGIFRNQNYYISIYALFICGAIYIANGAALATTLLNRYLLAFPTNLTKWFKMKHGIYACVILLITAYVIEFFGARYYVIMDLTILYRAALEYDPCIEFYILTEPSFVFVPLTNEMFIITLFITLGFLAGIGFAGLLGLFFIYLVLSHKSQTLEKLQKSLIISAFVQLSISACFLFLPFAIFAGTVCFQIRHMENIIIFEFCVVFTHSFLESLATLYFVSSYRKGVAEIFSKYIPYFKCYKTVVISPSTHAESIAMNLSHRANRRYHL